MNPLWYLWAKKMSDAWFSLSCEAQASRRAGYTERDFHTQPASPNRKEN